MSDLKKQSWMTSTAEQYGMLIAMLVLVLLFTAGVAPGALSVTNLATMTTFGVEIGLLAFGETLVILGGGGGIELSVGSNLALTQILIAVMVQHHVAMLPAALFGLIIAGALGSLNGLLIVVARIPAIIVTLGTLYAYSGLALVFSNGVNLSVFPNSFNTIGQGSALGLPFQFLVFYIPVALIMWYITTKAVFGYQLRLVGTNEKAARFSGINVGWVRFRAYMLTGLLCGLAAIIQSSRFATARPDAGATDNLNAIAIAVLGGTYIFGGRGTIIGTALATAVVTMLSFTFGYANINSVIETGTVGAVLIIAIYGQTLLQDLLKRRGRET